MSAASAAAVVAELQSDPLVAEEIVEQDPQALPSGSDGSAFMQGLSYTFSISDFGFSDAGDIPPDLFASVRIASLPERGTLMALGAGVAQGQFITVETIQSGQFRFDTAGIETVPFASFTFQVVDDSPPSGEMDPTPNIFSLFFDDPDVNFVRNVYGDILDRAPEAGGLTNWLNMLAGGTSPADIAAGLWDSFEHRALQVDEFYDRFYGRDPDVAGRQFWIDRLLSGIDEEQVISEFITTDEYLNGRTNEELLTAFYTDLYDRQPDQVGFDFWLNQLQTGAMTRAEVGMGLVNSVERDLLLVQDYYSQFYSRLPELSGLQFWTAQLNSDLLDDRTLAIALMTTPEYFNQTVAV